MGDLLRALSLQDKSEALISRLSRLSIQSATADVALSTKQGARYI